MAITWQNVNGGVGGDPSHAMALASKTITDSFAGASGIFKEQADTYDKNNTRKFLDVIDSFKSTEEFATAQRSGLLDNLRTQFGNRMDQAAVRTAEQTQMGILQQRALANQQFADQQTDVAQRPVLAGYQGALAQAKTSEDVRGLMESMQAARGAGAIDSRAFSSIMKDALTRDSNLVTEDRAAVTHTRQGLELDSNIIYRNNQDRIAQAKANAEIAQANEMRLQRKAALDNSGVAAKTRYLESLSGLIKEQTTAADGVKKNTPYAEMFGGSNMDSINKAASDANDKDPKYGNAVIDKITELRKTQPDIPVDVIKSAISMARNEFGASLWRSDGYSNSVVDHIKNQMKDPKVLGQVAFAKEQLAKSLGSYSTGVPATGAAIDKTLPPQLQFNPPKESKSGSLLYEKPGSFNISSNKGIMAPATLPTGNMDVTVKDGDTFGVKGANGVSMDFRFNGLDAQETGKDLKGKSSQGQKYSEEAKAFITEAFKKGKVDIRVASNKPDSYGRMVADVFVNGENLNETLLRKGLASVLKVAGGIGPSQTAAFENIQKQAMRDNLGIMGDLNSERTPTGAGYRMFGDSLYN